ncbi:pancreatic triacylglycerol lipase-like isoform X2 [Portunus trituberculatus]|nr:pancreatic triacylglycerol lipase-like isoform X2 [Portunus trituberculatus]
MMVQGLLTLLLVVAAGASLRQFHDLDHEASNDLIPVTHHAAPRAEVSDIRFLLWTRENSADNKYYQLVFGNLTNLKASPLKSNRTTHVLYHGFSNDGLIAWIRDAKTAILKQCDCNIITVDWKLLAAAPWYFSAVSNVYKTAKHTASLLDWMAGEVGLMPKQLHITGHSLGAHCAGLTGKYIKTGLASRVTGLDPAGPLFYFVSNDKRLYKTDAEFVDVLHTNGGSIIKGECGLTEPLGHVDYYPNGGQHQPGCLLGEGLEVFEYVDLLKGACSHMRAPLLWIESIAAVPPALPFTSWPCSDWDTYSSGKCPTCGQGCLNMGYQTKTNLRGSYFLRTKAAAPYALGDTQ